MIETFKKMTLTRKVVVFFLLIFAMSALFDNEWIGAIIITWIAWLTVKLSTPHSAIYHQEPVASDSDDDSYWHQQEEDDAFSTLKAAAEDRINEENRMNQEALDRLL